MRGWVGVGNGFWKKSLDGFTGAGLIDFYHKSIRAVVGSTVVKGFEAIFGFSIFGRSFI